ncbi:MAG TPA: calcium-binding protein [Rhizomicrobium sp.]|jgi:Ca2+-binding RTX toxin-like protein
MATFTGTSGNDNLTGTSAADTFNLSQGGDDTAQGLGGNDLFIFGGTFTAADSIDGGDGADVLRLDGDYSAGVVFTASTMTNVETIQLNAGNDYNFTLVDANVAPTGTLTVTASLLGAGDALTLDASQLTSGGAIAVTGGGGNDTILGGNGNDRFAMSEGGNDTVRAGNGDDTINMGGTLTHSDRIDGGAGNDILSLNGDYTTQAVLNNTTITGIETVKLGVGHSYNISFADGNVAPHHGMTVDGSALGAGDSMTIDISRETDGHYLIIGGAGNDTVHGAANNDNTTTTTTVNVVDFSEGGEDSFIGSTSQTTILMGAALDAGDDIQANSGGNTTVVLNGDYTGANALTMTNTTLNGVGGIILDLDAGNNYHLVLGNADVDVKSLITSGNTAYVDASATTSEIALFGSAGTDTFIGGSGGDFFYGGSGTETFTGGSGADTFVMTYFTNADTITGGAGNDVLQLISGSAVTFGATTLTGVETMLWGSNSTGTFDYVTNDATVAAGATLTVDMTLLANNGTVTFDGSAETDGHFDFLGREGSAGSDVLIGGALSDTFNLSHRVFTTATGGGGADTFSAASVGPHSADTFVYNAVSDSTSTAHDVIHNMNFTGDFLEVSPIGAVTGVDAAITSGDLSTTTFNTDLATAVDASHLAAHHAVLFTATDGTLAGHTILVVDENGVAGYQSGGDLVIDVSNYTGTLAVSSFT